MKDINATILVDLTPSEEEIFKKLDKNARWGINRAKKEGLIIEESNDWESFYPIYKQTMIDGKTKIYPLEFIKSKSQSSNLFLCKYKDEVIGGLAIGFREDKFDKTIPSLSKLASKKEYQHLQTNDLLVWEAIKWSKDKNYLIFDLGGFQIKSKEHLIGINNFKRKYGKIYYYQKDYPIHIAVGRKLIRNVPLFWWIKKRLK